MQLKLPDLSFAKFRFTLEALETLYLPEYKGSTLRGGFGHSFRKVVCTMGPIPCETCLLQLKCPYPQFFETPIAGEAPPFMRGVKTGPQPFIVEPTLSSKKIYEKGEQLEFDLVLIGRAVEYLPYFIYTFDQLGIMGIGRGKGKFKLNEVAAFGDAWQPIYNGAGKTLSGDFRAMTKDTLSSKIDSSQLLSVCFLTPTRIKTNGRLTGDIDFRELVINLLRRICTLAYFHMPEQEIEWNWRPILDAANEIEIAEKNLRWHDWERYSNRQKTHMKMGGFLGEVTLRGDLGDWLPLLRLGEFVHVGKGATFGLGKYELNTEAH